MTNNACGPTEDPTSGPAKCTTNMGQIHMQAGDLVSAYRYFLPTAENGNIESIDFIIEICNRAGDTARATQWEERKSAFAK